MRRYAAVLLIALCGQASAWAQEPAGRAASITLVTTTVTIESIDRATGMLTVKGANGSRMTLKVADPKLIEHLAPGDRVQISYAPAANDGDVPVVTASVKAAPSRGQAAKGAQGEPPDRSSWSVLDASGSGVLLGRGDWGSLTVGAYALVRYTNQLPANQSFTDHLGRVHEIDTRNDIQFHRAMIHFKGWLGSPKLRYQITVWTLMSTNQTTLYGFIGYQAHRKFNVYGGINALPGSRSLLGSHPYWLANDRVMADEFFRPSFSGSFWVNGELWPGFWYMLSLANNLSQLGLNAKQLTRDIGTGVGAWWMPTTKEFGPNGSYGDWEYHEKLATRFGFGTARSPESRMNPSTAPSPDNAWTRMADSLLLWDTGALAPGVTVLAAHYRDLSIDAGIKYKGIFLQTEIYNRWLDSFQADGPLPVSRVHDAGFYVQGAFYPIKKKLELYGATSWIYGDKSAGYGTSHEYILGGNFYPFNSRNYRVNAQVIEVDRSPVSSLFGFYVGGQKGPIASIAASVLF